MYPPPVPTLLVSTKQTGRLQSVDKFEGSWTVSHSGVVLDELTTGNLFSTAPVQQSGLG